MLETPVVLIIFNRPDLTKEVFERIRAARPSKLFIVSDAARESKVGEDALVDQCREVLKQVDWPCDLQTKIAEQNLGCRKSVSQGLTWVFSMVEKAIILEDDCLPSQDFFSYCDALLSNFQNDLSVGSICGSNLDANATTAIEGSYYFSNFPSVWGWATWKRVWDLYEDDLTNISMQEVRSVIKSRNLSSKSKIFWISKIRSVRKSKIDTWDYQLVFAHWRHGLSSIISKSNLISNIGFGENATHTSDPDSVHAAIPIEPLALPLKTLDSDRIKGQLDMNIGMSRFEESVFRLFIEELILSMPLPIQIAIKRMYLRLSIGRK